MNAQDYWQLFLETGLPEYYLLYSKSSKTEASHVLDDTGAGAAGDGLQRP